MDFVGRGQAKKIGAMMKIKAPRLNRHGEM